MACLRSWLVLAFLGFSVTAVGCSSADDESDDIPKPLPVSAEQTAACAGFAAASCARRQQCSPLNIPFSFGSVEACETRLARVCERTFALEGVTQTVGRVQTCAASMPTAICGRGNVVGSAECDPPAGVLADGEVCATRHQCASGDCAYDGVDCLRCQPAAPKTQALGGDCDLTQGIGCAVGRCVAGSCKTDAAPGEACGDTAVCTALLACRDGVCSPAVEAGSACTAHTDCHVGYDCSAGKCSQSVAPEPVEGAPCGFFPGNRQVKCNILTQYCMGEGDTGTCQPKLEFGQSCAKDVLFDDPCEIWLECVSGKCRHEPLTTCN